MADAPAPKRSFKLSDLRFGEGEGPALVEGRAIFAVQPDLNVKLEKLVLVAASKLLRVIKLEIGDETFEFDRTSHSSAGRYVEVDLSRVTAVLTPVQHAFLTIENDGTPISVNPILEGTGIIPGETFKSAVTLAFRPKVGKRQCRTRIRPKAGLNGSPEQIMFNPPYGLTVETLKLFIEEGADDLIVTQGKLGNVEVLSDTPAGYLLEPRQFGRIAIDTSNGIVLLIRNTGDKERFVEDVEVCGSAVTSPARRRK